MTLEENYEISFYKELTRIKENKDIYLVKHIDTGELYVKKREKDISKNFVEKLQKIHAKNVPEIKLCVEDGENLIVIEEYIHGNTLYDIQKKNGNFALNQTIEIILEVCDILEIFHNQTPPVVHRDIKPMNVMISQDGVVKLIDFGIAKESVSGKTEDTFLGGTKEYAAPEQYGFGQSDARTDIYAIGVMMNVMLTGLLPKEKLFDGEVQNIIKKCTHMAPDLRYQNVLELKHELEQLQKVKEKKDNRQVFHAATSKNRLWREYLPVGFRSGNIIKAGFAILGYFIIIYATIFTKTKKTKLDYPEEIYFIRLAMFFLLTGSVVWIGNYLGIRQKFMWMNGKQWQRIVFGVLYLFVYYFLVLLVTALLSVLASNIFG